MPTEAKPLARRREVLRRSGRAVRAGCHGPGLGPLTRSALLELVAADAVEQSVLLLAALAALGSPAAAGRPTLIGGTGA